MEGEIKDSVSFGSTTVIFSTFHDWKNSNLVREMHTNREKACVNLNMSPLSITHAMLVREVKEKFSRWENGENRRLEK